MVYTVCVMEKRIKIGFAVFGSVAALVTVLAMVYAFALDPFRGVERNFVPSESLEAVFTREQALEDLNFMMGMLHTRHPAWLERDNERVKNVEAQYQKEIAFLPDTLTTVQIWQTAGRILHQLYDGHTSVYAKFAQPLYINDFSQLEEYGLPLYIDGLLCSKVLEDFSAVFQYELDSYAKKMFSSSIIINRGYLAWAGVDVSDGVTYTFSTADGEKDFHYDFVPFGEVKRIQTADADEEDWVYYEIDKESNAGIFTLTSCSFNDHYREVLREFFEAVNKNALNNVIVDLRDNGGGNSLVANEFLKYIDVDGYYEWGCKIRFGNFLYTGKRAWNKNKRKEPVFAGNLYVLTSTKTFSSAMDFAMLVGDNRIGTLVGEPCGNLPDAYGDVLNFVLPNTKLSLGVSFKRWFRIDEAKTGQPLNPDIYCSEEEALDKALELCSRSGR